MGGAGRPGRKPVLRDGGARGLLRHGTYRGVAARLGRPDRDADFWAWLTQWTAADAAVPRTLRHSSRHGPLLEICPAPVVKGDGKNRLHLDVRLEENDELDEVAAEIRARGGSEIHADWGDLKWHVFADPSGNEFCVLPHNRPEHRENPVATAILRN